MEGLERLSTTDKGRMWEEFCKRYLLAEGFEQVWLLSELPSEIRESLDLGVKDMGIDIVVLHEGRYQAVQCKYRKRQSQVKRSITVPGALVSGKINGIGCPKKVVLYSNRVGWKEISTFYALCARTDKTANWSKLVIMTTANSVGRQGKKDAKDKTYAWRGFEVTERKVWLVMAGSVGHRVGDESVSSVSASSVSSSVSSVSASSVSSIKPSLTPAELRAKRMAFYS